MIQTENNVLSFKQQHSLDEIVTWLFSQSIDFIVKNEGFLKLLISTIECDPLNEQYTHQIKTIGEDKIKGLEINETNEDYIHICKEVFHL